MDHNSTYCYLLSVEDSCDETTWGIHLLNLSDRGLDLERTIADGGKALRAGQKAAWGDAVPCDAMNANDSWISTDLYHFRHIQHLRYHLRKLCV